MASARRFAVWCVAVGLLWLVAGLVLAGWGILGREEDAHWSGLGSLFMLGGVTLFAVAAFFFAVAGHKRKPDKERMRKWRP